MGKAEKGSGRRRGPILPDPSRPMVRRSAAKKPARAREKPKKAPRRRGLFSWVPRKVRIAFKILLILLLIPAIYTGVRGVKYFLGSASAIDRMPGDADWVIYFPDLDSSVKKWEQTLAWTAIHDRILKDKVTRETVNATLTEMGLPTLDELNDERFLSSGKGKLFRRDFILDLIGRDAAVAMRRDDTGAWRFCVSTRMNFLVYWAAPFLEWFPGLYGGEDDGDGIRLSMAQDHPMWIRFDSGLMMLSDDVSLLDDAQDEERRYRSSAADGSAPVFAEVKFRSKETLEQFDALVRSFPIGILVHYVDMSSATGMQVTLDLQGSVLTGRVDVLGSGGEPSGGEALRLLEFVPGGSGGSEATMYVQPTAATARELWAWLDRAVNNDEASDPVLGWAGADLRDTIKLAREFGFETDVLPLLNGPSLIALGWEPFKAPDIIPPKIDNTPAHIKELYDQPMLVGAVLFHTTNAVAAERKMHEILKRIMKEGFEDGGTVREIPVQSSVIRQVIPEGIELTELMEFVSPCFTRFGDTIAISTHIDYMKLIVNRANQMGPSFLESGVWQGPSGYSRALQPAGLDDVLEPPFVSAGVMNVDLFRRVTRIFISLLARHEIDYGANMTRIRQKIQQKNRQRGRPAMTEEELGNAVRREVQLQINAEAKRIRAEVALLQWFGTLAIQAQKTNDGLSLRWALELFPEPPP